MLTGFKYIGKQIKNFVETYEREYLFGYEESYGCLAGTYTCDKDSVAVVMLLCEIAAWCKNKKMTLYAQVMNLYKEYGYFTDYRKGVVLDYLTKENKLTDLP